MKNHSQMMVSELLSDNKVSIGVYPSFLSPLAIHHLEVFDFQAFVHDNSRATSGPQQVLSLLALQTQLGPVDVRISLQKITSHIGQKLAAAENIDHIDVNRNILQAGIDRLA